MPILIYTSVNALGIYSFFLIGGYLITLSWLNQPNPLVYAIKRACRILPALFCYCIIAVLIIGPVFSALNLKSYFLNLNTYKYFSNIIFKIVYTLPGVFETLPYPNAVNGSLWCMPVEVALYFILPVVLYLLGIKSKRQVGKIQKFLLVSITLFLIVIEYVHRKYFIGYSIGFYNLNLIDALPLTPLYFIGACVALIDIKEYLNVKAAAVLLIIFSSLPGRTAWSIFGLYIVWPYLVFSIAFSGKMRISSFFDKYDISYGIFLYGFPIQQILISLVVKYQLPKSQVIMSIISMLLSSIAGFASYYLIENRANHWAANMAKSLNVKKGNVSIDIKK